MAKFILYFIFIFVLFSCNGQKENRTTTIQTAVVVETDTVIEKDTIAKDFLLGKFDYKSHTVFVKVDPRYSSKTLFIQKEVYQAFLDMRYAAAKDGINLIILSGTRNFNEQKAIWERKWNRYNNLEPKARIHKIMEYSSMPSTSRHHWGTDIDLNSLNNNYFNSGTGKKIYDWLSENAQKYGFHQTYKDKTDGRTGYNLERWHWSYFPLAETYLKHYNENITYEDISGFSGSEYAQELNIITNYVNGIAK